MVLSTDDGFNGFDGSIGSGASSANAEHMLQEIYQQPRVLQDALSGRFDTQARRLEFDELRAGGLSLAGLKRIYILACGTSYHAGLIAKAFFEQTSDLLVEVCIASEFELPQALQSGAFAQGGLRPEEALFVAISQSGQTSDTLAAVRQAKLSGAYVIAITNVEASPLTQVADASVYVRADTEQAVPATKSFMAQICLLSLLAYYIGQERGQVTTEQVEAYYQAMNDLPDKIGQVLDPASLTAIQGAAAVLSTAKDVLFIGRGIDVATAYEGALKLKETSYIHAEAFAALEFRHGPISLIDPVAATPVLALLPADAPADPIYAVLADCRKYGARLVAIAVDGDEHVSQLADAVVYLPPVGRLLTPFVNVVALQLLAYNVAKSLGRDVDNPRYLSKAVTVD